MAEKYDRELRTWRRQSQVMKKKVILKKSIPLGPESNTIVQQTETHIAEEEEEGLGEAATVTLTSSNTSSNGSNVTNKSSGDHVKFIPFKFLL